MDDVRFIDRRDALRLRFKLKDLLVDWGYIRKDFEETQERLAVANTFIHHWFGFNDYREYVNATRTDIDLYKKLELLCGENGYAIFKMMEARKSENDRGNKHTDGC